MFYLSQAYGVVKKNIFLTTSFLFLTFLLFFTVVNFNSLQESINKRLPKVENELYLNALMSSSLNLDSIVRKVEDLPGVKKVRKISKEESQKQISTLEKEMALSSVELKELNQMRGVHITLDYQVSQSSINLIREYMTRLTGSEQILIGQVKKKFVKEKIYKALISNVKRWPLQIGIAVSFIFWLIAFSLLKKEIVRNAYVIESFQRRKNVALKVSMTICFLNLLVSLVVSFVFFVPNLYATAIFVLAIGLLTLSLNGKKTWVRS